MKYKCKRCGHEWDGRNKTPPKACARCKSYRWNQPRDAIRKVTVGKKASTPRE